MYLNPAQDWLLLLGHALLYKKFGYGARMVFELISNLECILFAENKTVII